MLEIVPLTRLNAALTVPGSKYVANRALAIAALADGDSVLRNLPDNNDIRNAITALSHLGIRFRPEKNALHISGTGGRLRATPSAIDVGESGTLLRFITAMAALAPGRTTITGSARIQERPIRDLLDALRALGIKTVARENGCPPVAIEGGTLRGGSCPVKGDISSQYISGLLLIAPFAPEGMEIRLTTGLVSKSYVDLTIGLMAQWGVGVTREGYRTFSVAAGQSYRARDYTVPGDWSSANYFFAAAAILNGRVTVKDLDLHSLHGESKFINVLEGMGCRIESDAPTGSVTVSGPAALRAVDADMSSMPDAVQTLAAVAAFADGQTRLRNIGNLRFKECDRIDMTADELRKTGVEVRTGPDEMLIQGGGTLVPAIIDPHNDHRMAMSFALIGLRQPGIRIANPSAVDKSFPGFWDSLTSIGVELLYGR